MGIMKKKHYDSDTLAFKEKAVKENNKQAVMAIPIVNANVILLDAWE